MPNIKGKPLAASAAEFASLLERCEITGKNCASMGLETGMESAMKMLIGARENGGNVYIIGNGGSSSVASHAAIDFLNVAKLRAFTLHEPSLLTCMANDYGYENAYARLLSQLVKPGDILIAISSSGKSMNIRNAVLQTANCGGAVITLSGFSSSNSLRSMGDLNFWLDSHDYGFVEIGHQFILHNISDRFGIGFDGSLEA